MPFHARNAHYLRISAHTILPLYLYLDDRHIEWMTDRTFQCVIADLQPLIPLKFQAEATKEKRGTVEVISGDHYRFAFFFRKVEPHALIIKNRYFVTAPRSSKPKEALPRPNSTPSSSTSNKRRRTGNASTSPTKKGKQRVKDMASKYGTVKSNGKRKAKPIVHDGSEEEESLSNGGNTACEGDEVVPPPGPSTSPRRSGRTKKPVKGGYRESASEEDEDEEEEEDTIETPALDPLAGHDGDIEMSNVESELITEEVPSLDDPKGPSVLVKPEINEPTLSHVPNNGEAEYVESDPEVQEDQEDGAGPSTKATIDIEMDEIEEKPKPMLQLRYQGFSIHDRCLCVIVEPLPGPSTAMRSTPAPERAASRAPSIAPLDFVASDGSTNAVINKPLQQTTLGSREPLFLPDYDRDRSMTPAPVYSGLSMRYASVAPSLQNDSDDDEIEADGGLLAFSQVLNSLGGDRSASVDDDDDIDGGVLFGDADERRAIVQ